MTVSDAPGRFGEYGGRYVPEVLVAALQELEEAYQHHRLRRRHSPGRDDRGYDVRCVVKPVRVVEEQDDDHCRHSHNDYWLHRSSADWLEPV